ncbi:MAG: hypothetical protein Q4A07_07570 [Coriobacteriales bacterium]|nr:hypothetical protein [Coriobacteriales bacterium]
MAGLKPGSLYQFRVRAVAGDVKGAWSNVSRRYLRSVRGIKAIVSKSSVVTATWKADPKASGYVVVVRYEKGGKIIAKASVPADKTSAIVKGLKPGKKLWVEVRPVREYSGKSFSGVLHDAWAK